MCITTDGAILFLKTVIACDGEILMVGYKKGYTPYRGRELQEAVERRLKAD